MWNIIFGLLMIAGGLSGKFTLLFTQSSIALVGLGAVLVVWGGWQEYRRRRPPGE